MLSEYLNRPLFFWFVLTLPGVAMLYSYATGVSDAMDMLHPTGETSARLLIIALMITPLLQLTRGAKWMRWLQDRRRYIGVAAFLYGLAHLVFYVIDMGTLQAIASEIPLPGIWTGWIALLLMVPLAMTSTDAAMRALKRGWKRLQRLAYPAVVLTLAHWIIIHNGLTAALVHVLPLALLELYRLIRFLRKAPQHA